MNGMEVLAIAQLLYHAAIARLLHYAVIARLLHYAVIAQLLHHAAFARLLHHAIIAQLLHYTAFARLLHHAIIAQLLHYTAFARLLHYAVIAQLLHHATIAQLLRYTATNPTISHRYSTPFPLTVHQATRSKEILELPHNAGVCMSYDQLNQAETALSENKIDLLDPATGALVPKNLIPGRRLTNVWTTLTYRMMQDMFELQHVISRDDPGKPTDDIDTIQFHKRTLQVPEVLGEVQEINV